MSFLTRGRMPDPEPKRHGRIERDHKAFVKAVREGRVKAVVESQTPVQRMK
jgi:hypothetical protein